MATTKKKAAAEKTPWDQENPKKKTGAPAHHLTPAEKASAKASAKKAGRPYPNLVDNMKVAAKKTAAKKAAPSRTAAKKTAAKKTVARKTASSSSAPRRPAAKKKASAKKAPSKPGAEAPVTKDPKGGLTAAGRAEFARTHGSHLKPGVQKPESAMTPEEMKRKGSWAVRFYGRSGDLPPLQDAKGEPTRFALTAAAWGEPVPKTEAAARKIAEKGRSLLDRYHRRKDGA